MEGNVQIKAYISRDLKRRAFSAFAMQETTFSRWLRQQLNAWLRVNTSRPTPAAVHLYEAQTSEEKSVTSA